MLQMTATCESFLKIRVTLTQITSHGMTLSVELWNVNLMPSSENVENSIFPQIYRKLTPVRGTPWPKQKQHNEFIINEISNTKSSKSFWKCINFFMFKPSDKNMISFDVWYDFSKNLYSCDIILDLYIHDIHNPILDDISLEEVKTSLKRCKKHKGPGCDGLSFEFYQNLLGN